MKPLVFVAMLACLLCACQRDDDRHGHATAAKRTSSTPDVEPRGPDAAALRATLSQRLERHLAALEGHQPDAVKACPDGVEWAALVAEPYLDYVISKKSGAFAQWQYLSYKRFDELRRLEARAEPSAYRLEQTLKGLPNQTLALVRGTMQPPVVQRDGKSATPGFFDGYVAVFKPETDAPLCYGPVQVGLNRPKKGKRPALAFSVAVNAEDLPGRVWIALRSELLRLTNGRLTLARPDDFPEYLRLRIPPRTPQRPQYSQR